MKYPILAPVVLLLEKSVVHYGMWNQEIMNSRNIYPLSPGKNYVFWNVFLFIREPLEKVVQKEMEGIFSLCGLPLYFGMLAIQVGT